MAEYSIEFRILAVESGWGEIALQSIFSHGLSETIKDELAVRDETQSLKDLISLATRLDNGMREQCREKTHCPKTLSLSPNLPSRALQITPPVHILSPRIHPTSPEQSLCNSDAPDSPLQKGSGDSGRGSAFTVDKPDTVFDPARSCQKPRLTRSKGSSGEPKSILLSHSPSTHTD